MKRSIKIILILFAVVGSYLLLSFAALATYSSLYKVAEEKLMVLDCLKEYLIEHIGDFPSCEEDLLRGGYLKKEFHGDSKSRYHYLVKTDLYGGQYTWIHYKFNLLYGAKVENIDLRGGILFDKKTNKQILLVNGGAKSVSSPLEPIFRFISYDLYKEMVRLKNGQKNK